MVGISVVIINYNYERFLASCVLSVLNQTVPAKDIVVVDDGSNDHSVQILKQFGDRIVVVSQRNRGHTEALNTGFSFTTGDICLFLDADDMLYRNCLEEVTRSWVAGDVKLQFQLDTIDSDGINQKMPFPHFTSALTPEEVRRRSFTTGVYPWTVSSGTVLSRKFLQQVIPIDSSLIHRSPDGYLSKIAPLFGDVRSLDRVLGAYRVHGSNAWAQSAAEFRIGPIERWVKFDRILHANFESIARSRGITVVSAPDVRSVQQSEHRIILWRVDPGAYPYLSETRLSLFRLGAESALMEPGLAGTGRIIWMIWLSFLLFAPERTLKALYIAFRRQSGRGIIPRIAVKIARRHAI